MKVSAVLYDNDIEYHSTSLKPFKRYHISNAKLMTAYSHFKVGPYEFSWIITNTTPVELIVEPVVPRLPFSYSLCPFNEFIQHEDKEFGFNVKAVAVHAFPRRQISADFAIREIVIVDERYTNNKSDISQILHKKANKQVDLLYPPPPINEALDVPTAVATINAVHTGWVTGQIQFTATDQEYYYAACANCHKKVTAAPGWFLHCTSCDEYEKVELRCRVPMELTGGNKSLQVVMSSPNVESLTRITAQQLSDSNEFDFEVHKDLQMELNGLDVICFIKKYDTNSLGKIGAPGIRYSVVKAYTLKEIHDAAPIVAAATPSSSAVTLPLPTTSQ